MPEWRGRGLSGQPTEIVAVRRDHDGGTYGAMGCPGKLLVKTPGRVLDPGAAARPLWPRTTGARRSDTANLDPPARPGTFATRTRHGPGGWVREGRPGCAPEGDAPPRHAPRSPPRRPRARRRPSGRRGSRLRPRALRPRARTTSCGRPGTGSRWRCRPAGRPAHRRPAGRQRHRLPVPGRPAPGGRARGRKARGRRRPPRRR